MQFCKIVTFNRSDGSEEENLASKWKIRLRNKQLNSHLLDKFHESSDTLNG